MTKPKDNSSSNNGKVEKRGKHPNSLKNLIPIKPGQVLNPGGMPKGSVNLTSIFRRLLAKEIAEGTEKTVGEALVAKMINQALKGSFQQQNLIVNRHEGNVPFRIAGADGDELFAGTQDSIEKIFSNPKAMEAAIKLANCLNEIDDKPKDGDVKNGNGENTTNSE